MNSIEVSAGDCGQRKQRRKELFKFGKLLYSGSNQIHRELSFREFNRPMTPNMYVSSSEIFKSTSIPPLSSPPLVMGFRKSTRGHQRFLLPEHGHSMSRGCFLPASSKGRSNGPFHVKRFDLQHKGTLCLLPNSPVHPGLVALHVVLLFLMHG